MNYNSLEEGEVKDLAVCLYRGLIFTSEQVPNIEDIPMVFIPLSFISKEIEKELRSADVGMLYEYMNKAANRSINGMPIFMSFRFLSKGDATRVLNKYNEIIAAIKKI